MGEFPVILAVPRTLFNLRPGVVGFFDPARVVFLTSAAKPVQYDDNRENQSEFFLILGSLPSSVVELIGPFAFQRDVQEATHGSKSYLDLGFAGVAARCRVRRTRPTELRTLDR
jgi:hypothetical protein